MEKFKIDPNEERQRHEKILNKIDPGIAKILRSHLTYAPSPETKRSDIPEEQEKVKVAPEVPPRSILNFKTHIELSQPREDDDKR